MDAGNLRQTLDNPPEGPSEEQPLEIDGELLIDLGFGHRFEGGRSTQSIGEQDIEPAISMVSEPKFRSWCDWYRCAGLSPAESECGVHIYDSAAALRVAIAGNGVALGRTTLVERDLAEQRLVCPFGPTVECTLAYHVVCRPQDADDPTILAFRDWLIREAARESEPNR